MLFGTIGFLKFSTQVLHNVRALHLIKLLHNLDSLDGC